MLLCPVIEPVKENRHVSEHKILSHSFADEIDIEQPMNKMYSNMSVIQNQYTYERFLSEILPFFLCLQILHFLEKKNQNLIYHP